jgi:hypothetical protein
MQLTTSNSLQIGHDSREIAVMIPAKPRSRFARNHRSRWREIRTESPLMFRKDLERTKKRKTINFLMSYGKATESEKKILLNLNGLRGFQAASNSRLRIIADIEISTLLTLIANDKSLSPANRASREEGVMRRAVRVEQRLTLPE